MEMVTPTFDHLSIDSSYDTRSEAEEKWVSFQPYLFSKGYGLRARYQPNWTPSWLNTGLNPLHCEDSVDSIPIRVLDAIRIRDEQQVMIKIVIPTGKGEGTDEYAALQHFSTPALRDDPSNHVVPLVDSFPIPGVPSGIFIVTPLLGAYDRPLFHNLAEVHDFLKQLFDGVCFMHTNNVAHCDIASANVLMDSRPLYNEPFHPFHQNQSIDVQRLIYPKYKRSQKGTRYYFIDLGYAKFFRDSSSPRVATGTTAREIAPEQSTYRLYDPFAVDVYQLGVMIRKDLIDNFDQLEFLLPLVDTMAQEDPNKRPKMSSVRVEMNAAFSRLSSWRYRWPLITEKDDFFDRCRILLGRGREFY
ncbi:unnamed protein product [Rhizoctonia solani]|uniref:Protein kinase domain-containing protein n=1 Tax=Rhizoctonia solani TaxID=456999 RepID=A0A8H3CGV0_9AGAM|nr:unnamed protein product [Rhizoctonia solani]